MTTVTVNNSPSVNITASGPTTFCAGGTVILNASGASTYQWNTGATSSSINVNQTGTYTVTGTSSGCSSSISQSVVVNPNPSVSLTGLNNFTNYYASPIILNGSPSGGIYSGSGVTGNTFNPSIAGLGVNSVNYNYTSASGCSGNATQSTIVYDTLGVVCTTYDTITTYISVTDTLIINTTLNLPTPNNSNTILIYPNPASDHITIDYGNYALMNGYQLTIENSLGQQVFQTNVSQQSDYLSLATWGGNGLYYVNIIDPQGNIIDVRKIVLQ